MMKTPVVLVAAALTAAILLAATLVIATGTRGDNGKAVFGELRVQDKPPSLRGANGSRECAPDDRLRDEAIQLCRGKLDCFACARNDGKGAQCG